MKTYVITISKTFPKWHCCQGKETMFRQSLENGFVCGNCRKLSRSLCKTCESVLMRKIHTIRGNYEMWKKRFEEIENNKACLSVREWAGKPYRSKQVEIARLTKDDGIGLQKLVFILDDIDYPKVESTFTNPSFIRYIANNDGLSVREWKEWFESCDTSEPLAIIQFTKFRY